MSKQAIIRKAEISDAMQIAEVNTQSWKETYPGIMPEEKLARLNVESCHQNWLTAISAGCVIFVACIDNEVVGFVSGGINREQDNCETGAGNACECELAAMYLLQKYHKQGIGRNLFDRFKLEMQQANFLTMVVWVAEKNSTTGFYASMGGEQIDRKILDICNTPVPVVAYKYNI